MDGVVSGALRPQIRHKAALHMCVSFATERRKVALLANVTTQDDLRQVTLRHEPADVLRAHFIGWVSIARVSDVVDAQKNTLVRNFQQHGGIVAVAEVTDDNSLGRDLFFAKKSDLLQGELAEGCRMSHDAGPGTALRPPCRPETAPRGR